MNHVYGGFLQFQEPKVVPITLYGIGDFFVPLSSDNFYLLPQSKVVPLSTETLSDVGLRWPEGLKNTCSADFTSQSLVISG